MRDEQVTAAAEWRASRRASLRRMGRTGLGIAAGMPLAGWLAGCGQQSVHSAVPRPSPSPTTARPAATATPDPRPVTIGITGDVMLGRSVNEQLLGPSGLFPFEHTADVLRTFDLIVGNLECVVSTQGTPEPGKQFTFEADPRGFARLALAGFDTVSVANHHSRDHGKRALIDLLAHLPLVGVTP